MYARWGCGRRSSLAVTDSIGEWLVEKARLAPSELERARRLQRESGQRLGVLLVSLGLVGERDVAEALAGRLGLEVTPSHAYPATPVAKGLVAPDFLRQLPAVPVAEGADRVVVAFGERRHGDHARGRLR